jgi:hypothetical protein
MLEWQLLSRAANRRHRKTGPDFHAQRVLFEVEDFEQVISGRCSEINRYCCFGFLCKPNLNLFVIKSLVFCGESRQVWVLTYS